MRRIIVTGAAAAVFAFIFVSGTGAERALAQSKKPSKSAKAAAPALYGNADAITEDELKVYDYFLASDQLEGRYFPSRGYDTAALYVASHLAEWGLKPGGSTSGTNGPLQPYFMPMEMVSREIVPEDSKITLTAPAGAGGGRGFGRGGGAADAAAPPNAAGGAAPDANGGGRQGRGNRGGGAAAPAVQTTTYDYTRDWTFGAAAGGGGGRGGAVPDALDVTGNLVFAGNGYVVNKTSTDPYKGIDVKGKIIVVAGVPAEIAAQQAAGRGGRGRGGAAGDTPDPLGESCKDYWTPEQYGAKNGALAVVTIANFQTATAMAYPNAGGRGGRGGGRGGAALNGPAYTVAKFRNPPACPVVPSITAGMELTNALLAGEKVTGSQAFAVTETNAKTDSFELNAAKKLTVHLAVHSQPGHAEDVVGILEGSDPVLKDEYVIMSAHLDHIGLAQTQPDGHNVNNGADDDGSGSTGLLGVAHAFAEGAAKGMRPKRSILFLWNGGEERGLWGSQYFTQFPPIDLGKVVADLNMDMIGRTKNANSVDNNPQHYLVDPGGVLLIGPGISSDDLEHTIEGVNDNYQKMKIDHFYDVTKPDATHDNLGPQPRGQRIFYRSDHYNFAKVGIPIAFFTIGLHVDYHQPTDTPEKIDYKEIQLISKTVAAVGWELATQSGRPKLKENLPEELVKDMKTVKEQGWGKITPVLPPLPGEPF